MRALRKLFLAPMIAVGLSAGLLGAHVAPAGAAGAAAAGVIGSGTVTPAIDESLQVRSFTFTSATITLNGVNNGAPLVNAASSCTASGASIGQNNIAVSADSGTASCSTGPLAGRSATLTSVRVGGISVVVLTGGIDAALVCGYVPHQIPPPVTSYDVICAGAGVLDVV